jgi:hypothetical protein
MKRLLAVQALQQSQKVDNFSQQMIWNVQTPGAPKGATEDKGQAKRRPWIKSKETCVRPEGAQRKLAVE